tara:strand:- start:469 stop:1413 length:945 start_codon:yes stop_codon:yes gene_type:complete
MIKKNISININAPARLHFGFLDLGGNTQNALGAIGVAINKFNTIVNIKKNHELAITGNVSNKALNFVKIFCKKNKIKSNYLINIEKTIPEHIGLGSGTQLALSIGTAISKLNNLSLSTSEIGKILDRGKRSKIGIKSFSNGGFLIDLGIKNKFFPNFKQLKFPNEWKILLIQNNNKGLYGAKEQQAFKMLQKSNKISLHHLALMQIYPALLKRNFKDFSKSITKIQNSMGKYFCSMQGGKYSNNIISKIINFIKKEKILGYGQTSWGPTGFAFLPNPQKAKKIKHKLEKKFSNCNDLQFIICSGKNIGATIKIK